MSSQDINPDESVSQVNFDSSDFSISKSSCSLLPERDRHEFPSYFRATNPSRKTPTSRYLIIENNNVTLQRAENILGVKVSMRCL